ncbi:hypothetical protein HK104_003609 [Borealophlyctis nickersoniae]|nr:hypothetical protein HK104_003609 [Borealophlyctis nickersoniae]
MSHVQTTPISVHDFLRSLHLDDSYLTLFDSHGVTDRVLPKLTESDLIEMGITKVGHRRVILDGIHELRNSGQTGATTTLMHSSETNDVHWSVTLRRLAADIQELRLQIARREHTITRFDLIGKSVVQTTPPTPQFFHRWFASRDLVSHVLSNTHTIPTSPMQPFTFTGERKNQVQNNFHRFFSIVPTPHTLKPTSNRDYLKHPIARISISILDGTLSLWAHLVSLIEVKDSLTDETQYHDAAGRIINHFSDMFGQQPGRQFVMGAAVGPHHVELYHRDHDGYVRRSGLLDLDSDIASPGLAALLGLVTSSPTALGFVNPVSATYRSMHLASGGVFEGSHMLRQGQGAVVVRGTVEGVPCVMKMADPAVVNRWNFWVCWRSVRLRQGWKIMGAWMKHKVTSPFGHHLEADMGVVPCLRALIDVVSSLEHADAHGIRHRDVSYLNIITHAGKGYLIDWGTASLMDDDGCSDLTPTHPTLSDDLESLFYVFLYVATDGHVLWNRAGRLRDQLAMKEHVINPASSGMEWQLRHCVKEEFKEPIRRWRAFLFPESTRARQVGTVELRGFLEGVVKECESKGEKPDSQS